LLFQKYCDNIYLFQKKWNLERGEMQKITEEQAKAIRRKRADSKLTKYVVCKKIGITEKTFNKIENGDCFVKPTIYAKVMEWLAEDF